MLKHIFHRDGSNPFETPDQLERLLAQIALNVPETYWVALITSNGRFVSKFPASLTLDNDRITAMSVAAQSLGERISQELKHGALQYTFIAGAERGHLVIVLNKTHSLAVSLRSEASLSHVLEKLQPAFEALLRVLGTGA